MADKHQSVEVRITIGPTWFLVALCVIAGALGILGWLVLTGAAP